MKVKFHLLVVALFSAVVLQSCSDDDDPITVSEAIQDAFATLYPSATNVEWEIKSGYYVAEFWQSNREVDVWFSSNAEWCMTETDLGVSLTLLPDAVQTAFASSDYSSWTVDDIDQYERPNDEVFYLIEIETAGQADRNVYYDATGTLLKDAVDTDNDDVLPTTAIE